MAPLIRALASSSFCSPAGGFHIEAGSGLHRPELIDLRSIIEPDSLAGARWRKDVPSGWSAVRRLAHPVRAVPPSCQESSEARGTNQ